MVPHVKQLVSLHEAPLIARQLQPVGCVCYLCNRVFFRVSHHWSHVKHFCSSTLATHRYIWRSRPDVGRLTSGAHGLISATLCVPARCPVIVCILQYALTIGWVQSGASCLFRSALMSVVSFHVVVGPSLLDGTAPVGGPDAGQVLQRGQPDNSLVRMPSYACSAKNMSRPMDHQTPSKEAATVAAV